MLPSFREQGLEMGATWWWTHLAAAILVEDGMSTSIPQAAVTLPRQRGLRLRSWIAVLLLLLFASWVIWSIIQGNEAEAVMRSLESDPHSQITVVVPDWVTKARESKWVPGRVSQWLAHRYRIFIQIDIEAGADSAAKIKSMMNIASLPWPDLIGLTAASSSISSQGRVLLPITCPKLELLSLVQADADDTVLSFIADHYPTLTDLHLPRNPLTGTSLSKLRQCPQLARLYLDKTLVTDATLQDLPCLPSLESLSLSETNITGATLFDQGVPPHLQSLTLDKTRVELNYLAKLQGHPQLSSLILNNTPVSDAGLELVGKLPALWNLDLEKTQVSDAGIRFLVPCSHLVLLDLGSTRITDASGPILNQLPELAMLHLARTAIGNDFLAALHGHPKLWDLSLNGTKVNDQALPSLLSMPSLKRVVASQGQFSQATIQRLDERMVRVDILEERSLRK